MALQTVPVGCIFAYLNLIALSTIILKVERNDDGQTLASIKYAGKVLPKDRHRAARFVYVKRSVDLKNARGLSWCLVPLCFMGRGQRESGKFKALFFECSTVPGGPLSPSLLFHWQ